MTDTRRSDDLDDDFAVCITCGEPNDDGDGWDGQCGNCADACEGVWVGADHPAVRDGRARYDEHRAMDGLPAYRLLDDEDYEA